MLILKFRSLSPSKRLPIKSVVLKIPHMLRLVIFYQDGKAAGVYFGLLAKGGADNQVPLFRIISAVCSLPTRR